MDAWTALSTIPEGLRKPLLAEYKSIIQNYAERRWSPSELSGGKFCEIVYSILDGHSKRRYPSLPTKPRDMVSACRALESNTHVPRSFQILIPRILPALYEVRNNRGVGHVGGDVDPNHMDATVVVSMCNWIMAELVRVFHNTTTKQAQILADSLAERRIPLVWEGEDMRRVLDPSIKLKDQILILIASTQSKVLTESLLEWTGYKDRKYFFKTLRALRDKRMIELAKNEEAAEILPPGSLAVEKMVAKHTTSN